jgi:chromate transporter
MFLEKGRALWAAMRRAQTENGPQTAAPAQTPLDAPAGFIQITAVPDTPPMPAYREALRFWLKLGFISFGGPAGQIAIMHRELVEKKRWISDPHFLHALNFCTLLPGPEAQQLATYLGWRLHGVRGGIAAGALFVLPSVFILYALSWAFITAARVPWLGAIFYGLAPGVIAIVAAALIRIGRKALRTPALWVIAGAAFALIFFAKVSFVAIVAGAGLLGWLGSRAMPAQFPAGGGHGGGESRVEPAFVALPPTPHATISRSLSVIALCGALWWLPVIAVATWLGWDSTPARQGIFFSQAALVTFGGAYAVLPYVAQQAVERFGWLTHGQMMSGLGLAETTPGPLIMVLQFVGFVGGWNHPGALPPPVAATLCALITTWATFLPSFLMVFLGAPLVEGLRRQPRISAALGAITAAVVGVILNLGVVLTRHTLLPAGGFDTALAFFRTGTLQVIASCAILGVLWRWLGN